MRIIEKFRKGNLIQEKDGTRIPLGDRDSFSNPDIRWGLLPWTIGGTAGYKYLNTNNSHDKTNN